MKILFLHGWQSVPGGVKPTFLARHGHEVINPKLPDEDFNEAVRIAGRWLSPEVVRGRKAVLHAPLENFHAGAAPAFLEQLLSEESLRRAGYFESRAVAHWRGAVRQMRAGSLQRLSVEVGLLGVIAAHLWHQAYLEADLPGLEHQATAVAS
jgi:hypothetical protein